MVACGEHLAWGQQAVTFSETLRYWYLAFASRPSSDRMLFRLIKRRRPARIVEIGLGDLARSLRMVRLAQAVRDSVIVYAAIDAFDLRGDQLPVLPLKSAYRQLKATGANVRVLPGDPYAALSQKLHLVRNADLLLIAAHVTDRELERAWSYLPAAMHASTAVYRETALPTGARAWRAMERQAIDKLAAPVFGRRAA